MGHDSLTLQTTFGLAKRRTQSPAVHGLVIPMSIVQATVFIPTAQSQVEHTVGLG